ncbi:MAG: hypothetical protein ACE5KG_01710 [Nitrososphaerales archaeon]
MIQLRTLGKQTIFGVMAAVFVVAALLGVAISMSNQQSAAQAQILPPGSEAIEEIAGEAFSPDAIGPDRPFRRGASGDFERPSIFSVRGVSTIQDVKVMGVVIIDENTIQVTLGYIGDGDASQGVTIVSTSRNLSGSLVVGDGISGGGSTVTVDLIGSGSLDETRRIIVMVVNAPSS